MKIETVMTPCPYQIANTASVHEALDMMKQYGIRHLPVVDEESVTGVISEETARNVILFWEVAKPKATCGDVCKIEPYVVTTDSEVSSVAKEMAERKLDCALVTDSTENFVGIFTTTDAFRLVYLILSEQEARQD